MTTDNEYVALTIIWVSMASVAFGIWQESFAAGFFIWFVLAEAAEIAFQIRQVNKRRG